MSYLCYLILKWLLGLDSANRSGAIFLSHFNTLRLRQNGCHFAYNIFKCIVLNENFWIWNKISLKYVRHGPVDKKSALVQIMAWRRSGDKPLLYPPHNEVVGGYTGFTPSVRPSVRPSVCPSVRPASRVRSVAPTILIGSISYVYILSSNFRRCVAYKVSGKISKFVFLAIS